MMRLFTTQQTESWQNAMLDTYAKAGALHDLCWFVQMIFPPLTKAQARGMSQQERQDHRYRTACWPKDWVPIVRVADPALSRVDVEVLVAFFAAANEQVKFAPALGLVSDLATLKHYEFGSEWDCVCSLCGMVFGCTVPDVDICDGCADKKCKSLRLRL